MGIQVPSIGEGLNFLRLLKRDGDINLGPKRNDS